MEVKDNTVQPSDTDKRSIFIKNLTRAVNADMIYSFFESQLKDTESDINKITIVEKNKNKKSLHGYVEFTTEAAKQAALSLDNTLLDNVKVRIYDKRTNLPEVMLKYDDDDEIMLISS